MIIELFGPPAAGKTTFARALAARLAANGLPVKLILSYRPAESDDVGGGAAGLSRMAVMHRLTRPAIEWLATAGHMMGHQRSGHLATELLDLLPPRGLMWPMRLRQYISRLENSWRRAAEAGEIVIVDQGFVQVVCSLVLLARVPGPELAGRALDLVPHADQLIHLNAPVDVLRTRLEARRKGQSWLEQPFELDTETSMRTVEIAGLLHKLLSERGLDVASVDCREPWTHPRGLDEIGRAVVRKWTVGTGVSAW